MRHNSEHIYNLRYSNRKTPCWLRHIAISLLCIFTTTRIFGQDESPCAHEEYKTYMMGFQNFSTTQTQTEAAYQLDVNQNQLMMGGGDNTYIIPCVVHVMYDNVILSSSDFTTDAENTPDQAIINAICLTNKYLAGQDGNGSQIGTDTRIQLRLATIDPQGNVTNGIEHHLITNSCTGIDAPSNCTSISDIMNLYEWDNTSYLNIYSVDLLYGAIGFGALFTNIWVDNAQLNLTSPSSYQNSKTLVHEVGHFFNLYHIEGCHDPANCQTEGDMVCDTEMTNSNFSPNCNYYNSPAGCSLETGYWPKQNFMAYSCIQNHFTQGQIARMHSALETPFGYGLWSEDNLNATGTNDPYSVSCCPLELAVSFVAPSACTNDGSITIAISGAQGATSIKWYNNTNLVSGANGNTLNNISAGIYDVQVFDAGGCFVWAHIIVPGSATPTITGVIYNITCDDDQQVCANVSGGTPPYAYQWSNGQTSQCFPIISEGYINLTVTDAAGCTQVTNNFSEYYWVQNIPEEETSVNSQAQLDGLFPYSDVALSANLTFASGNYLIQNKTIHVSNSTSIIINPGVTVEFRNCDFIPCDGWWQGFRVKSDPGPDDLEINDVRGVLILAENSNGTCYIEGAISAIQTGGTWGQNGTHKSSGRIKATKAHFYNCLNSFDIRNGIDKGSYFRGCNFEVDTYLQTKFPNSDFFRHMYYQRTFGYPVQGCTFTNSNQLVSGWGERRYGIYAYNSPVRIGGWDIDMNGEIQAQERSTFEGFNCGFRAYVNNGTYNGLVVKDCEFHQNKYAIYCNNVCFHYLDRNYIHVGEPTGLAPLDNATGAYAGIYQYGGAQFEIMENHITGYITGEPDLSGPTSAFSVGICIARTKTADDEVYRNYLQNLNFGNLANGDNNEGTAQNGLRYVCNENTGNHYDFAVSDNIILVSVADIAEVQTDFGATLDDPENSAANKFFSTVDDANIEYQNFWNVGVNQDIEYRRYALGANETPTIGDYFGIDITAGNVNQCASETHKMVLLDGSIDQVELNNWNVRKATSRANWQSSLYLWKALIDGGNTEQLQDEIDFAWTADTWAMRTQLLAKSPYLSRDVLYGVAEKTIVFPHPIALEIFLANPDVLRDNRFIAYLQTKADPMPEYMIDLLLASRDQATFRTMLENNLSKHRSIYMEAAGKVLRTYLQDENYDQSLFIDELKALKTFNTELLVVEDYLQKGNTTAARDRYDDIPTTCELTRYEKEEWIAYGLWLEVREAMLLKSIDYDALGNDEVATLIDLAEANWNSYAGRYAQEILNEYYAGEYEIEPMVSEGSGDPRSSRIANSDVASLLNVYPNPASDYFLVQLALPTFVGHYQLIITDATGKLVRQLSITNAQQQLAIDVQQWSSGSYQVTIVKDQKVIETKEINVVR
jgi:hypothetical protein